MGNLSSEKRERAVKWLTEELRSLRMAPKINGCGPENWADMLEIMETCLEAVRDYHFPDTREMVPMTMEQLKKMDGKPVSLVFDFELEPMTALVECVEAADCIILTNNLGGRSEFYSDEELRESGIKAYAYHPAHIDRQAWTAEWVDNDQSEEMMCKCSKCGYPVSYFWGKTAFCPGCGKAMTPDAWAELEKRLRG